MAMDFYNGGSLQGFFDKKHKKNEMLTNFEASQLMKGIINGVSYLHQKNIVHRDLKPQNILIEKMDDLSTVKLIDFGLGRQNKNSELSNDLYCGTLTYMAPEVAMGQMYTKSVDVWAIGIIMHIAITGKHPFYDHHDSYDAFKDKLKNIKSVVPHSSISDLAQSLLHKLVAVKPHQRYNVQDCLQHPWVTRDLQHDVPLSFLEKVGNLEMERKLHNQIKLFMIFAMEKATQKGLNSKKFEAYKEKCYFYSRKIDKWHRRATLNFEGQFKNDEDFDKKMSLKSPNKFSNSSSSDSDESVGDTINRCTSQVYKQSMRLAVMNKTQKNKVSDIHK
jgi:serine/threonine protein kinase